MVDYGGIGVGYEKPDLRKNLEELIARKEEPTDFAREFLDGFKHELPDMYEKYGNRMLVEDPPISGMRGKILSNYKSNDGSGYIIFSRKLAGVLNDLFTVGPRYPMVYGGIRMMVNHEAGHIKYGISEKDAQIHAMEVSDDLDNSMSAMISLLAYVNGQTPSEVARDGSRYWGIDNLDSYVTEAKRFYKRLSWQGPGRNLLGGRNRDTL